MKIESERDMKDYEKCKPKSNGQKASTNLPMPKNKVLKC